ncbi:MAG: RNA-guided pseudouridylation complex pseudouridine synthase subunit Cbf5 [Candidatus Aenigmatarchaeota archaeon]
MSINGFIIVDKPKGIKSNEVCKIISRIADSKKVGHSGTLDPNATGVLLVCINSATKIIRVLQKLDKRYIAIMHTHQNVTMKEINLAIKGFVGKIIQIPPVRSAVARKPRKRIIYSIKIVERSGRDIKLDIRCQSGTYIRKLISDIGNKIGGAHLKELRRISVGKFSIEQSHELSELEKNISKAIMPIELAISRLKKLIVTKNAIKPICNGKPIIASYIKKIDKNIKKGEIIRILDEDENVVALGRFVRYNKIVARVIRVIVNDKK